MRDALERRGLRTARLDWARRDFDWSRTRSVLFRTTWDYFHRIDDFRDWLDRVSAQTRLPALAAALRDAGWSDEDVEGFCYGNWRRLLEETLPADA